ncbi:thiolase family protein [Vibrio sonorensis]|uniref:thiolase family protein n=1 Tax=Vibrio sonorensis TaxID=1004316 RepID=UPI0008D9ABB8|nr:thiolase family protein [Vibrio sonorensis]
MPDEVCILAAKRTPIGRFQGKLKAYTAPVLGGFAISALFDYHGLSKSLIDELYFGCVLTAGLGQAPARQAGLKGGLSESTPCSTVNKVCGSGMKAVMLAYDSVRLGAANHIIAGGMESMSNAPYLLSKARSGLKMGHANCLDHMFTDGLEDAYEGHLMGVYAQQTADHLNYTRKEMDNWAILSAQRAKQAQQSHESECEIVPIATSSKSDDAEILDHDEHATYIDIEKIATLKPVFHEQGTITAANSSAISDGAAALHITSLAEAKRLNKEPLALIKGHSTHARTPAEFTLAPVFAIEHLLSQLDWQIDEVDLWEINEAFAVVTQLAIKQLGIDGDKVNVKGGACALGHPIGATGARIIVTLAHSMNALKELQIRNGVDKPVRGIASLCIGGGEATAIAIEVP